MKVFRTLLFALKFSELGRGSASLLVLVHSLALCLEQTWPRILKPVRKRKRHVICKLCSSGGMYIVNNFRKTIPFPLQKLL